MCRRNLFYAGVLLAFGAGVLVSMLFESQFFLLLLGVGAIVGGLWLLKK